MESWGEKMHSKYRLGMHMKSLSTSDDLWSSLPGLGVRHHSLLPVCRSFLGRKGMSGRIAPFYPQAAYLDDFYFFHRYTFLLHGAVFQS